MSIFPVRRGSENPGSVRVLRGVDVPSKRILPNTLRPALGCHTGVIVLSDAVRIVDQESWGSLEVQPEQSNFRAEPRLAKGRTSDHQAAMSVRMRIVYRGGVAR